MNAGKIDQRGVWIAVAAYVAWGLMPLYWHLLKVVPAMQNKVVDCAITGSLSGYSAKWYEVATHLYALPINWSQQIHAVNQKTWTQLDPSVRSFLQKHVDQLVENIWNAAGQQTQMGFDCNTGSPACKESVKGKMVLVQPTAADRQLLKKTLEEKILPKWAARCSSACVQDFNAKLGPVLGVTARK